MLSQVSFSGSGQTLSGRTPKPPANAPEPSQAKEEGQRLGGGGRTLGKSSNSRRDAIEIDDDE